MSEGTMRPARPDEWKIVRDFSYELTRYERENFPSLNANYPYSATAEKSYKDACAHRNGQDAFIYETAEGEIAGFAVTRFVPTGPEAIEGEGKLLSFETMYLKPEHRGGGTGQRMIDYLIDLGQKVGATKIWINYEPGNERVKHLYTKRDFKTRLTYMEKVLEPVSQEAAEVATETA